MTKSELNVFMYGLFLAIGIGLPFLAFPHYALGLFGMTAGDGMWVRMVGVLAAVMGGFYVMAVQTDTVAFYEWTVPARLVTAAFHVVAALLGLVGPAILLFAAIDAVTAGLTRLALGVERKAAET